MNVGGQVLSQIEDSCRAAYAAKPSCIEGDVRGPGNDDPRLLPAYQASQPPQAPRLDGMTRNSQHGYAGLSQAILPDIARVKRYDALRPSALLQGSGQTDELSFCPAATHLPDKVNDFADCFHFGYLTDRVGSSTADHRPP